jgi:uncharacterized protein (TIGR03437 family)
MPRPVVADGGIVEVFSGMPAPLAPGKLITIYGENLGPAAGAASSFDPAGRLPLEQARSSVTVNSVAAPILFASAGQINAQVPYEVAGASMAEIAVKANGEASTAVRVPVAAASPDVYAGVFHADGSRNSPENSASSGSVVVLFATGQGVTVPASATGAASRDVFPEPEAPVRLLVGGREAEVLFRGQAPGTAGVMQVNARLPQNVPAGRAEVTLEVGGVSNRAPVYINMR